MSETKRIAVGFIIHIEVPGDSHADDVLREGYERLMAAVEQGDPQVGGSVMNSDGNGAIYNPAEVVEVLGRDRPKVGDTVRMWLADSSVRGTFYVDEEGVERIALLPPGVDPLNAHQDFQAYLVTVNGRRRRMELAE